MVASKEMLTPHNADIFGIAWLGSPDVDIPLLVVRKVTFDSIGKAHRSAVYS
jgi:hypothetical protein